MMTRNRWFALGTGAATAALALGVAAAIVISARGGQLIHEQDGQGVLASAGGPGVWNGFAFREDDPGPWTMGYRTLRNGARRVGGSRERVSSARRG